MKIEIKDMPMVFQMTNKTDIHTLLVLDWCRLLNGDAKIYVYKWFFLKKHSFFIYDLRLYWYFIMKIIIKIKRSTGTNSSNNNISCTFHGRILTFCDFISQFYNRRMDKIGF